MKNNENTAAVDGTKFCISPTVFREITSCRLAHRFTSTKRAQLISIWSWTSGSLQNDGIYRLHCVMHYRREFLMITVGVTSNHNIVRAKYYT